MKGSEIRRQLLYVQAGFLAGLIGILGSQFLLLTPVLDLLLPFLSRSEIILFPIASTSLAVSMVWAEIFLNNPTRLKDNWQVLPQPTLRAIWLGMGAGILAAFLSISVGQVTTIDSSLLKLMGWVLIGAGAGAADGYSWRFRTIEGSQRQRARQRLINSVLAGSGAGLVAFLVSKLSFLVKVEEMAGFIVLGTVLGVVLSLTAAASLCFALRAGAGFELDDDELIFPRINSNQLGFNFTSPHAKSGYERRIEEGISIELPERGIITLGSDPDSHIFVPVLPYNCAELEIENRQVSLRAKGDKYIIVDKDVLRSNQTKQLKHNQILTFIALPQQESKRRTNFVRFVFYDRFLDPQA